MTLASRGPLGTLPVVGSTFEDAEGRKLVVAEVEPNDRLGREVRGVLIHGASMRMSMAIGEPVKVEINGVDYACTLATWETVWFKGEPPTPRERQAAWIGGNAR